MSAVYKIVDENGTERILVSKEYVDLRIQAIVGAVLAHERNIETAHINGSETIERTATLFDEGDIEQFSIVQKIPEISASTLQQDSLHRMLSDAQIELFKKKPSVFEVENLVNDLRNEMKTVFNEQYVKLLNTPNILERLRALSELIKENDTLTALSDTITSRITKEEFNQHIESHFHLDDNDRNALNILIDYITDGSMGKIALIGKHSETADKASNAERLNGLSVHELNGCQLEEEIYGLESDYKPHQCTKLLDGNFLQDDLGKENLNYRPGIFAFKPGEYRLNHFDLNRTFNTGEILIKGSGNTSKFLCESMDVSNASIENISINNAEIHVYQNVSFKSCKFSNCKIVFMNDSQKVFIQECEFDNCGFSFGTGVGMMMIIHNYLFHSPIRVLNNTILCEQNISLS